MAFKLNPFTGKLDIVSSTTTLDGRYVNVTGDTMTGDLTMDSSDVNLLDSDCFLKIGLNIDNLSTLNRGIKFYSAADAEIGFIRMDYPNALNQTNNGLLISTSLGNIVLSPNGSMCLLDDKPMGFGSGGTSVSDFTIGYNATSEKLEITPNTGLGGIMATEVVYNENGVNCDWRMEGDTDTTLFFLDASADFIGIGTSSPGSKLDVNGSFQCNSITNDTGLAAGTYTPTRSAETNMDSNVTMTEAQYMRVGNTVTVSGRFTADPTLTATTTSFEITLPVSSNIGAAEDVAGVAFCGNIVSMGAEVIGVAANDTAKIQWKSSDVTSQTWSYTFTYQVI